MRKLLLAAAAATLLSTSASAEYVAHCTYSDFFGARCTMRWEEPPPPPTAEEIAEKNRQIAEWEDFCKPVGKPDSLGMIRLTYANPGCEYGRRK